jgi:putative ABC transport system permease protein
MGTAGADATGSAGDTGGAARRALIRWALRMFRQEWRQQVLVLSLLTLAVAAAVGVGTAGYNLAPVAGNAEFGTGNHFFSFDGPDSQALVANAAAAEDWFGTVDVIGHIPVSVPGRFELLEYRVQDPTGAYGAPLLTVVEGRYPGDGAELAVTDEVADEYTAGIGAAFDLDGTTRTVVGIVENPSDLDDEFVLIAPTVDVELGSITILVDADEDAVLSFRPPGGGDRKISSRGGPGVAIAVAVGLLGVTTVALLLVGLLASAGFMVIAQRRRRQLGMLAAIGATERHLRLALVANGAVVGAVAAVAGTAIGVAGWIAAQPRLEAAVGYRVARFDLPWLLIATVMVLGVLSATGAAWWPARMASRGSIVHALSGRPERPQAIQRSAALAGILVSSGVVALSMAGPVADDRAVHWGDVGLVAGGTVAVVVGVLLASPLAIRALASQAAPFPIAARVALRDLARYQSRSAAALAAITLALGIPIAIVVAATAAQHTAEAGNLADNQLLVRTADFDGPFIPDAAHLAVLEASVDDLVESLDESSAIALNVAVDPTIENDSTFVGRIAATIARRIDDGWGDLSLLYVASPQILALHGLDVGALDPETDIVTSESGELSILGKARPGTEMERIEILTGVAALSSTYTSLPGTFIIPEALGRLGLEAVGSGRWLIESGHALTSEELMASRDLAAGGGLTIETRDHQTGLARLRSGATAIGMLLALGVLAMTVGLIRSEAAGDLRILTATGATSTIRRAVTATTAGALAALGVALGGAASFIVLGAGYLDAVDTLVRLPVLHLVLIAAGTPTAAALAGWLLAGREPPVVSRKPVG